MKLTDKRLWQSQSIDDFWFRLFFRDDDLLSNQLKRYEFVFSYEAFISATFVVPDPSRCWGIDISHWNGIVDLSKAKAEGCSFVIIKGCDGSIPTTNYQQNRDNAKQNGLLWGVYDWLYRDANVNTTTQTNAWWKQVQSDYPPLGVYIDFEWTKYSGIESNPTSADLKLALGKFKVLSGRNAGIYSAKGYTDQYLTVETTWNNYLWWVASYSGLYMPQGITNYEFHQFSSYLDGKKLGINTLEGDGNYFIGTVQELYNKYGTPTPTEPPTGENKMYYKATGNINIRQGPGTSYPIVTSGETYVHTGDIIETEAPSGGFVRILKLYRNNVAMPIASAAYCGTAYLTLTTYTPLPASSASSSVSASMSPSISPSPSVSPANEIDFIVVYFSNGSIQRFVPEVPSILEQGLFDGGLND